MKWQLSKEKKSPVYIQIMELVIESIQNGDLEPDQKIPTERELASYFSVNRSTVVHALEELSSLGWIVRKQGSGTRVSEGNWGRLSAPRTNWQSYLSHNVFNQRHPYTEKIKHALQDMDTLDLYTGDLPNELIPDFQLPNYRWENFLYQENQVSERGYLALQQAIMERLARDHQLQVQESELLITSGAQQGMFLLLQVLLTQGDSVAIENPSFLYSLPIFQAAGIRLYGLEMDVFGIKIESLKKLITHKKIKMVLLNPNYQNPTGSTMSLERRKELIQLCSSYQIPIVEDDVFGDLNFDQKETLLKVMAPEQVIYLGSLSKILGSSTKIGWISAPKSLIIPLAEAKQVMDFSLSIFPQILATSALTDPTYECKLIALKRKLANRAELFRELMKDFREDWAVDPIRGGFYAWLTWQHGELTTKQWEIFLEKKIAVAPSFLFSDKKNALRVNFTRLSESELQVFQKKLRAVTKDLKM